MLHNSQKIFEMALNIIRPKMPFSDEIHVSPMNENAKPHKYYILH